MFIFNKKHKKAVKVIWGIIGAVIIVSMILLYTPIFF